jgi:hypothetical protein
MKLTILGSGSPEAYRRRASSGYLLDAGQDVILFDRGGGVFDNLLRAGPRTRHRRYKQIMAVRRRNRRRCSLWRLSLLARCRGGGLWPLTAWISASRSAHSLSCGPSTVVPASWRIPRASFGCFHGSRRSPDARTAPTARAGRRRAASIGPQAIRGPCQHREEPGCAWGDHNRSRRNQDPCVRQISHYLFHHPRPTVRRWLPTTAPLDV